MGKAKSAAVALQLGCQRSIENESDIVTNTKGETQESPYVLKSLEGFIRTYAYSIDGEEGIDVPGSETVRKHWNAFTAAWQRRYPETPIPRGMASSITQFINGPLAKEMGMPKTKRPRRFATKNVMRHFAKQLWAADWVESKRPATLVDDWGLLLGNAYSSSRIGEYIESSCRSDENEC
ncbi:hypothetical protein E0Z10_g3062 [Xylaria hypoxylon]|uniref:Uncharacterized protein n=1 Tax=Xylaria hypoxylon TaxID=37992 RepID=A0A4Z0Z2C3_9PEZI|nr:hypothetical protein E0Z10_g3062 [Xylaria hypoxylon]